MTTDKQFYNPIRFIKGGHLVDVKWLWHESNVRYPFSQERLFSNIPFYVAVTNVDTGTADYYQIKPDTLSNVILQTNALFFWRLLYRRGVTDSTPAREAYRRGPEILP